MERIRSEVYWMRYRVREWVRDTLPDAIAQRLPRRVVYFALIRAWVKSMGNEHPTEIATYITVQRWEKES